MSDYRANWQIFTFLYLVYEGLPIPLAWWAVFDEWKEKM